MPEARVDLAGGKAPLRIRINGPDPTFRLAADRIAAAALAPIDPLLEDLLEIACTVFAADSSVSRGGEARSAMGEAWRRDFRFEIPVRRPDHWSRPEVMDALVDAVTFLTEDVVSFRFTERGASAPAQQFLDLDPSGAPFEAAEVILFSGGLDSLAGALEVLSTSSSRVILVTHRSAQKVIPRQEELGQYLSERFPNQVLHLHVAARRVGRQATEDTQRSRSLLFAALGQAVAQCFGASRVSFCENGFISHNLPISPQVIGTMATRTTHPLSLVKLNALMEHVGPKPARVVNAYQWLTKAEVVARIARYGGSAQISQAVSCTSIRDQTRLHTHCGACAQCLDRRFAILANGLADHDPEEAYATPVLFGPRSAEASRKMAVEWPRHSLRLRELDDRGWMESFGLEITRIRRGHPDLSPAEAMRLTKDLHRRHSEAVAGVLETVVRDRASDIVAGRLEPTSLVALFLADNPGDLKSRLADPRVAVPPPPPIGEVVEEDLVPDPAAPLVAAFFLDGERHVVAVRGLTRVIGKPARVAHGLKPAFDQDRADGLLPHEHRFVLAPSIPGTKGLSEDMVRKCVERCRRKLATSFRELHGIDPPHHLLIENRQSHGYRLDPTLVLTTRERL